MTINKSDKDSAKITADILKKNGVVIIPTDTVYGFSGIVEFGKNPSELTDARIRQIKGRAETKPLIQLIAKPEDLKKYTDDVIPAELLSKWPGALTIIVHTKPESAAAKLWPTIAFRCPGDKWLRDIIEECDAPIFSTSVNRSGQPVLDEEAAINKEFGSEVDLIVLDGDKKGALPSTLVAIEQGTVKVLRQGAVTL